MRIFVTGVTGFIGSRVFQRLTEETGHEVIGLQRYTAGRMPRENMVFGDITDGDIYDVVKKVQPEIVVHIAALASNEQSNAFPVEVMRVNAVGTARLLSACKSLPVACKAFVLASSSEVYGFVKGAITEESPIAAKNPYAASKIAAEEAVKASGIPYVIMRPFNTYGRALVNLPRFVVDEAIYQALTTGKIVLRDPSPIRDFMFREDHVNAYFRVIEAIEQGRDVLNEAFVFGPGNPVPISGMANTIAQIVGCPPPEFTVAKREGDIDRLWSNAEKARCALNWVACHDLGDGLEQAIYEWRKVIGAQYARIR